MNKSLLTLLTLFTLLFLSACKYESASPIRDIKFDPKLLGRLQADGPATCTNHNFYEGKKLQNLGVISSRYIMVAFDEKLSFDERRQVVESFGFVKSIVGEASSSSARHYTLELVEGLNCRQAQQAIKVLSENAAVHYAAPYFVRVVDGLETLAGVSNELIVTVDNLNTSATLSQLTQAYNAASVTQLNATTFSVTVDKSSKGNALEAANYLSTQDGIEVASPEFIVSPI